MLPKITKLTKSALNHITTELLEDLNEEWQEETRRTKPNPHKQTFKPSSHKNNRDERKERRAMKEAFC